MALTPRHRAGKEGSSAEEAQVLDLTQCRNDREAGRHDRLLTSCIGAGDIVTAFDGLDDGIILFGQAGRVLHMNTAARAIVTVKDGLELTQGVLKASHHDYQAVLFDMMSQTLRVASGQSFDLPRPIGIRRRTDARPLIIRAFVSPTNKDAKRVCLLKIQDRSSWQAPTAETVQAATGLTPAESQVAVALLDGESIIEYALRKGLSEHTVRSHLKHIRSKLGVTRQANVVAVLARLCGI